MSRILLGVWDGRYRSVTGRGVLKATVKDPRIRCTLRRRKKEGRDIITLPCPTDSAGGFGGPGVPGRCVCEWTFLVGDADDVRRVNAGGD